MRSHTSLDAARENVMEEWYVEVIDESGNSANGEICIRLTSSAINTPYPPVSNPQPHLKANDSLTTTHLV